jgi:flagellar basal body-associated protein FliL
MLFNFSVSDDSGDNLPLYAIVLIVILLLAILCGVAGIICYTRRKKGQQSDLKSTVNTNKATAPEEPIPETSGRESAVYEDIKDVSNYQTLAIEMDEPLAKNRNNKDTPKYANIPNANMGTTSADYVNTSFNQE